MSRYIDKDKLGKGGFGEVYSCYRDSDNKYYAKKKLTDNSPQSIKRFQREVRLLSNIDHPRIIKVVATHLSNLPYWYVMPLYKYSLRDCLEDISKEEERIVKVFSALLEGIQYAHEQGVMHRDLKPENILMDNDDNLVVTDFGLGRAIDAQTTRATTTGMSFGTFGYMAPEQVFDAKSADHRCDIFALGRILYELYTLNPPGLTNDFSVVSPGIKMIIDRCTKTNPEERFQKVEELRTAFLSFFKATEINDSRGRINEIISDVISSNAIDEEQTKELASLLIHLYDDKDLIHEVCVKLPFAAIEKLWDEEPESLKSIINIFMAFITSQGWGFDYTDILARTCKRFYNAIPDIQIRATIVGSLVDIGVNHNRFYVLSLVAGLLETIDDPQEGYLVSQSLSGNQGYLNRVGAYITVAKIRDANIRALFFHE